ncbi:hypothetical protein F183_A45390 [Bryobacterales bacterium F-183]|nr:hypothetical protein F183_A45390 [Bryobacterales bacterium F-183]
MKLFRNAVIASAAALFVAFGPARANLSRFLQDIEASSKFDAVFFESVALPSGSVAARRAPAEARVELGKLIAAAPAEAQLYSLRALEAERQLDFTAAEADWKKYVELTGRHIDLADYYHRRLQPTQELEALTAAATPEAFARSIALIDAQAMDKALAARQYRAWVAKFPKDQALYEKALAYLNNQARTPALAREVVALYRQNFPDDRAFSTRAAADIEFAQGNATNAARIWDEAFDPLWPDETIARFFEVVGDRQLLAKLRNPSDLQTAAKLFHLQNRLNNPIAAKNALLEVRNKTKTFTATEWRTLGRLFEKAQMPAEAARAYESLYLADNEQGIVEVARLLLQMPDQDMHIGMGDLALYRDIATMDQGPGYLNGVLSLILNTQGIPWEFDQQNQASRAYFHRAKASELLDVIAKRFPANAARAELSAKLIESYASYGDRQGVIRSGKAFLAAFASSTQSLRVTFLMADAYAATNQVNEELAAYDVLLKQLAAQAGNTPVGSPSKVNSPDYVRALDRYVARLVALKRVPQALTVFRQEIDRNASDPGLYERFAVFLDQNKLGNETEQVYKQALAKFKDEGWANRLARWYLMRKQTAQFEALSKDLIQTFSGTGLEAYFQQVVPGSGLGAAATQQLNLYAHQRFPHNLTFVRNLLATYESRPTADPAAYERLLRQHWFEADDLRARFFALLQRTNRLQAELDAIRAVVATNKNNAIAARLLAEGEIWRTHYEDAAAPIRAVATQLPADAIVDVRAASLHRSLGQFDIAANIERNLVKADPRDTAAITRLGEMEADRERFNAAKPYWDTIPNIEPGKPEGAIEAATLYWDYFRFDDALRTIEEGRKRLKDPAMGAYEAGAIRENQRDYNRAIEEYVTGALSGANGERARFRLIRLAARPTLRDAVEKAVTAKASDPGNLQAAELRIDLLESQNRRADLERYLQNLQQSTRSIDVLARAERAAASNAMPELERRAMERRIELASDDTAKLRARLDLARFLEARGSTAEAARIIDQAYGQNPMLLGVVRTAANFYARNKDPKRSASILAEAATKAKGSYPNAFRAEAVRRSLDAQDLDTAKRLTDQLLAAQPANSEYLALAAAYYAARKDDAGLKAMYAKAIADLRAAKVPVDGLRRNLIPVLIRQKDFNAAADQYIELLRTFPEDDGLAREAARFALANNIQPYLDSYYRKAVNDSPKDLRWPLILSRMQSEWNQPADALASLSKATAIRPDRADLMIARGKREERQLQFEDALKTYQKVWELSYRDPAWMEKVAEQHLRLGRTEQAVATLKDAYLDKQPDIVIARLLDWNLVPQASAIATKATPGMQAVIAARLRQPLPASSANYASMIGPVVAQYYTPKEKAAFAATLRTSRSLELARAAGLADVEASLLAASVTKDNMYELVRLQRTRGRFDELGQQLEAMARIPARAGDQASGILREAAQAYRASGNTAGEVRVLSALVRMESAEGDMLDRYALLLVRQGAPALTLATNPQTSDAMRDALAKVSVFAAKPSDAYAILAARGKGRPPVWTSAYTALTSVYLGSPDEASFRTLLGTNSIGEQLATKPDRQAQLTGKDWFYYAARFGQNVASAADDYAAAELEESPATAQRYLDLGQLYLDRGDANKAVTEFAYALELQPKSTPALRRMAAAQYALNQRDEAVRIWRDLLAAPQGQLPELLADIARANATASLRNEIDAAIRTHFRTRGGYQAPDVLQVFANDPAALLDAVNTAPEPAEVAASLLQAAWLSQAQKDTLTETAAQLALRRVQSTLGEVRVQAAATAARLQSDWISSLLRRKETARAATAIQALPEEVRAAQQIRFDEFRVHLATLNGDFTSLSNDSAETIEAVAAQLDPKVAQPLLEYLYQRELAANRQAVPAMYLGLASIRLDQGRNAEALDILRRLNNTVGDPFETTAFAADLLLARGQTQAAAEFTNALVKARPWDPRVQLLAARTSGSAPALQAVAESSQAPYAVRVDAALALRKLKAAPLQIAGETELNLLSSAQQNITEQQASASPYTLDLRRYVAARTPNDASARLRLWSGVVAQLPGDVQSHRELFRAATAANRFQTAVSSIEPHQIESPADLRRLADAYLRLGRNDEALEVASRIEGETRLINLARRALQLQRFNESRMPVFHENYEQNAIVKPKLPQLPATAVLGGVQ